MIRSFLLDHDVDTEVFHENADALWCGAFAGSMLAISDTDLPSVKDAFSAPREALTEDSPIPDSDFPELDPGPIRFDARFFVSTAVVGFVFVWGFCLLGILVLFMETFLSGLGAHQAASGEPLLRIGIADFALPTCIGILGGLLASVAIVAARQLRRDEHGRFSTGARWGIFLVVSLMGYFIPIILAYLVFTLRQVVRRSDADDH